MPEHYDISPGSRPKPNQPESKKASRDLSDGPLSDRRTQIAVIVAAVVIVLIVGLIAIGAVGGPVKSPDLQKQLRREKALRDREEAPQDVQQGKPASGQSAVVPTD